MSDDIPGVSWWTRDHDGGLVLLDEPELQDEWDAACFELSNLLRAKQADYGPGNIMAFRHIGLMVRLSDKIERLKNLMQKSGVVLGDDGFDNSDNIRFESIRDTYMDIAGYGVIGMMLLGGTFPPKEG